MFEGNTQDELCIETTALKIYDNNSIINAELYKKPIENATKQQHLNNEFNYNYLEPNNEIDFDLDNQIEEDSQTNLTINNSSPKESSNKGLSKICRICGDKALAINYSILSCEACKAFFRRNALRNKNFKCPFNNKCEVDVVTRRFCQKCRLRKCFELGMKKEWILSDEEKKLRRLKIEQNKLKRRNILLNENKLKKLDEISKTYQVNDLTSQNEQSNSNYSSSNDYVFENRFFVQPTVNNSTALNNQFNQNNSYYEYSAAQNYHYQPEIVNQLVYSHFESYKVNHDLNQDDQYINNSMLSQNNLLINENNLNYNLYNVSSNNQANEKSKYTETSFNEELNFGQFNMNDSFKLSNCDSDSKVLDEIFEQAVMYKFSYHSTNSSTNNYNSLETDLLNELSYATKRTNYTVPPKISQETVIFDIAKMTDLSVRRGIKVAKKISFFKNLCEEDQISLLKGCCTEMILLKSINGFDESTEAMVDRISKQTVKLDILKNIKEEIYFEHKDFILSFKEQWRKDEKLISILMAVILFQPDVPNLKHRSTIKYIQTVYYYLLKRHLSFNYYNEQNIIFETLKKNFSTLKSLNEKYIKTYLEFNSDIIGPLLIELFDFNC